MSASFDPTSEQTLVAVLWKEKLRFWPIWPHSFENDGALEYGELAD